MTSEYQPGAISKLFSLKNSDEIDKSLFETPPQFENEPEILVVPEKPSKKRKKSSVEIPEQILTSSKEQRKKKLKNLRGSFEKPSKTEMVELEPPIKKVKHPKKTKILRDQGDIDGPAELPVIEKDTDEAEVPTKKVNLPKKIKNLLDQSNDEQRDFPVIDTDEAEVTFKKVKRPKKRKNLRNQSNDGQRDFPVIDTDEAEVTFKKVKRPKKTKNLRNQSNDGQRDFPVKAVIDTDEAEVPTKKGKGPKKIKNLRNQSNDGQQELPVIEKDTQESEVTTKMAKHPKKSRTLPKEDEQPSLPFIEKPKDDPEKVARTLFVGNLPTSITRKQIKALFSNYGKIESVRIRNAVPGKPNLTKKIAVITKTFHEDRNSINAYVVLKNKDKAQEALELNGLAFEGNHIRVDFADNKEHDHSRSIFVGNLPFGLEDDELRSFFNDCGKVESVRIIRDKATGAGKGFGYVLFQSNDSVISALKKNEEELAGRSVRVFRARKQKVKHAGRVRAAGQSDDTENNFQPKVKQPVWLKKSISSNSGGTKSFEGVRSVEDVKERLKIQRNIKTSTLKSQKNMLSVNPKVKKNKKY